MNSPHWRRLFVVLFVFALVAAACSSDDSDDTTTTAADGETTTTAAAAADDDETTTTTAAATDDGGTAAGYCEGSSETDLVWAHEQEPGDMHLDDPNNNLTITAHIREAMWEGAYGISAATEFFPELLTQEVDVVVGDDGVVTYNYTIRDEAVWSDGTPVTSADFENHFTVKMTTEDGTLLTPEELATYEGGFPYLRGGRLGYDLITSFNVVDDKNFNYTMDVFFAGYPTLFAQLMPAHAVGSDPEAANAIIASWTAADGTVLPSTGPMIFDGYNPGVDLHMVRNDSYYGSKSPDAKNTGVACVSGVQINFVPDTDAQVNVLKSGEADIIWAQPQLQFEDLATDPDFTNASPQGPVFEHWGFNLNNPHLAKPEVREALAYALNKPEVMELLYTPLYGDALPTEGLGNVYWMSNQGAYEDHQTAYSGAQVDEAKASLESAGYVAGSDGIYEHPDDGKLTLRVGTTGGNALRELQQQIIQAQMGAAGIEIVIDNVPGSAYFSEVPFSDESILASNSGGAEGDPTIWDITQFAWVGGPWPGSGHVAWLTGNGNNPYSHNVSAFDDLSVECDATVDDAERAACYNELDKYITTLELDAETGLVALPLTQKPSFFAVSNTTLSAFGEGPDSNNAGPIVNVYDYKRN
jgi:peptide/nickel transport system substrate-binding protein